MGVEGAEGGTRTRACSRNLGENAATLGSGRSQQSRVFPRRNADRHATAHAQCAQTTPMRSQRDIGIAFLRNVGAPGVRVRPPRCPGVTADALGLRRRCGPGVLTCPCAPRALRSSKRSLAGAPRRSARSPSAWRSGSSSTSPDRWTLWSVRRRQLDREQPAQGRDRHVPVRGAAGSTDETPGHLRTAEAWGLASVPRDRARARLRRSRARHPLTP